MTNFHLKILAITMMLIDHIGWAFFPQQKIFMVIGRLAFPIFAFFIAEGFNRTRNVKRYMFRLFIIAVVSQSPFLLFGRGVFGAVFTGLNTVFNLLMGLVAIYLYDKSKWKGKKLYIWIFAILSLVLRMDGDIEGVFMIYIFYRYRGDFRKITQKMVILYSLSTAFWIAIYAAMGMPLSTLLSEGREMLINLLLQFFALLALIPIKAYNGEKGYNLKYLFYAFYPVHLMGIYLIKQFVK